MGKYFDQGFWQGRKSVIGPFAHKAYLYPIAIEKIIAIVAEEKSGSLKPPADASGRDGSGQFDGNDGGGCIRVRSNDLNPRLTQARAKPARICRNPPVFLLPTRAAKGRMQGGNETGAMGKRHAAAGSIVAKVQARRNSTWGRDEWPDLLTVFNKLRNGR